MIKVTFKKLSERKYILTMIVFFILFLGIYTTLDILNDGYKKMSEDFSNWLVGVNIGLNIIMASLSALMLGLSSAYMSFSKREGRGSLLTGASVLFGLLTYACTPCVIAFFATIGITFSVAVLPLAGLPYKLISLLILLIGLLWLLIEIKRFRCKIKLSSE